MQLTNESMNKDLQNKIDKAVEAISPLYDPDSDHVTIRLVEEDLANKISDIAHQARNEALKEAYEMLRDKIKYVDSAVNAMVDIKWELAEDGHQRVKSELLEGSVNAIVGDLKQGIEAINKLKV